MIASEVFYIDPDEEIPSIISRLKSTGASFLVFVIPHRAALFSSVITMRLFKKEADRLEKDVFVVTQDEQGCVMAKRVGFIVRGTLEELPFPVDRSEEKERGIGKEHVFSEKGDRVSVRKGFVSERGSVRQENAKRESFLGTRNFGRKTSLMERKAITERSREDENFHFAQSENFSKKDELNPMQKNRSVASELSLALGRKTSNGGAFAHEYVDDEFEHPLRSESKDQESRYSLGKEFLQREDAIGLPKWGGESDRFAGRASLSQTSFKTDQKKSIARERGKLKIREMSLEKKASTHKEEKIGSRVQWVVVVSFCVILGMATCIGLYLRGSEADVIVHLKQRSVSGDVSYAVNANANDVGMKFLVYEDVISVTGNATGLGPSSGVKARGTVTLYNAFSKEAQPLVATTRLQTSDGQIFRITKSTVIPGFSERDGQIQPGSVRVDVQADEPGEKGNIGPTKFTIPGFSGGPKFEKVYAESDEAMIGGGSGDGKNRVISQGDIMEAKKQVERKVRDVLLEKAKTDVDFGTTSDDLIEVTFQKESTAPTLGSVTKTFDFKGKVQARYAVFSDFDARKTAIKILGEKESEARSISDPQSVSVEYGKMSVDFEKKTVNMKMFVTGNISSQLSLDSVREDLLGRESADLQPVLEKYPQIASFEVQLKRAYFQNMIPKNPEKVNITVLND